MKKLAALALAVCMLLLSAAAESELVVFAAASLTETLTELGGLYEREHPGVCVLFNFDSSGTLCTQIQEGAPCDIFISAGQRQMDEVGNLLLPGTRFDLIENRIVLALAGDNPSKISSFADLAAGLREERILLALGGGDVPAGEYGREILAWLGIEEADISACVSYASNVKEIVTQVREGMADCGIVYRTDAAAAGLETADIAEDGMCSRAVYPAAVILDSSNADRARDFLDFLDGETGNRLFSAAGFMPAE